MDSIDSGMKHEKEAIKWRYKIKINILNSFMEVEVMHKNSTCLMYTFWFFINFY